MAFPVFSLDGNVTLAGLWAAGIDFGRINQELQAFSLDERNKRVVYVDNNGQKIFDLDPLLSSKFDCKNLTIEEISKTLTEYDSNLLA